MTDLSFAPFINAHRVFNEFRNDMKTDRDMLGAIHAFEFTFELAWKAMKKVLKINGYEVGSPRDTFRKAASEGLIDDPQKWFDFLEKRNLSSHTYEKSQILEVIRIFDEFDIEVSRLIKALELVK